MANKLIQHGGAAAAGAATGPVGAAAWEIGYPLVENWLTGSDPQADAAKNQQAGMKTAQGQYEAYRQPAQQARQTSLQNQLSAYNGAAGAMNLMYGTQYDPRNYAPNLGHNPLLTGVQASPTGGGGAYQGPDASTVKNDSQQWYDEQMHKGGSLPAKAALTAFAPATLLTDAIAGGPKQKDLELFNTSAPKDPAADGGSRAFQDDFKAKNGRDPTPQEYYDWIVATTPGGASSAAAQNFKQNMGL